MNTTHEPRDRLHHPSQSGSRADCLITGSVYIRHLDEKSHRQRPIYFDEPLRPRHILAVNES